MPKVVSSSSRRLRAQQHHSAAHLQSASAASQSPPILLSAPRKVSFEDGHQSSSSFTGQLNSCSTSCSSIASSLSSSKSSLRRKAPSVCLVSLASEEEGTRCLSPTPSSEQQGGSATPSSPWGHFVDILVPLEEETDESNKRRRVVHLGVDNTSPPPLFGFFEPLDSSRSSSPTSSSLNSSKNTTKHKHRGRQWASAPHPYGLQPRHQQQRRRRARSFSQPKPSFLPGYFLEPTTTTTTCHEEVEEALERLQV